GGGRARRPAGDPARPVRGRDGARAWLLADDGLGHLAAGVAAGHPRHRQFLYCTIQGYDPCADRRDLRSLGTIARGLRRPDLGDPGDAVRRLLIRLNDLFCRELRDVALCVVHGAALEHRAPALRWSRAWARAVKNEHRTDRLGAPCSTCARRRTRLRSRSSTSTNGSAPSTCCATSS